VDVDFKFDRRIDSDLHIDAAISHLVLALKCPALESSAAMDTYFHISQAYITKLQLIIDKVPTNESLSTAIANSEHGLGIVKKIEFYLEEGLKRVTGANLQSTQDAYIYYYSCLKVAEYRMLELACQSNTLTVVKKEKYLKDAVEYIIDALVSRPMLQNFDLHYIASLHLSQMLLSSKRHFAAAKAYGKTLLVLSAMLTKAFFNRDVLNLHKLYSDESCKHTSQALQATAKATSWCKKHYGPMLLHERVASGYASWSFEDLPSVVLPLANNNNNK
jgi:hypothetical protein